MKLRRSTRERKVVVQEYYFGSDDDGGGDDDKSASSSAARQSIAAARDAAQDFAPARASSGSDRSGATSDSEAPAGPSGSHPSTPRRRKRTHKVTVRGVATSGSLPLHIVRQDRAWPRMTGYHGTVKKSVVGIPLLKQLYSGQELHHAMMMINRWFHYDVLPSKTLDERFCPSWSPWLPETFGEDQMGMWKTWWANYQATKERRDGHVAKMIRKGAESQYEVDEGWLKVVVGPLADQREVQLARDAAIALGPAGLPVEGKHECEGWMFDAGGLVMSLDWAPLAADRTQVLALAVVPFSDQAHVGVQADEVRQVPSKGTVQLWSMQGERSNEGHVNASTALPRRFKTLCLDWGRAKQVAWCPAPPAADFVGMLAVLCGDGSVRVLEISEPKKPGVYEQVFQPFATLGITSEQAADATGLTWVNTNRVCTAHRDGSVALWSLWPCQLLLRHPAATTYISSIKSAYPSNPYLVSVNPVGGYSTLIDLSSPSTETVHNSSVGLVLQGNTTTWSDHLQAFCMTRPSSNPTDTMVSALFTRAYPLVRRVVVGESPATCVASGKTHPFVLVGGNNGALWCMNPMKILFGSRHSKNARKIKLFEHEFRPRERWVAGDDEETVGQEREYRGAARVAQGWEMETNDTPQNIFNSRMKAKRMKSKGRRRREVSGADERGGDDDTMMDPRRGTIREPLTRVTDAKWNPNTDYGCWAAASMASGLVRVMDLGVDV